MSKPFDSGQVVKTLQNGIRDDFLGSSTAFSTGINGNWDIQIGAGMTVQRDGASNLKVVSGTTVSSVTTLTSVQTFSVPFRVAFQALTDKKISNCDVYLEIVNQSGDIVGYCTTGSSTTMQGQTVISGSALVGLVLGSTNATTSGNIWGIEANFEDIQFFSRTASNPTVSTASNENYRTLWTSRIPDPTQQFNVRVRMVNGGTAPASTMTLTIDFISIQDTSTINAEIVGGRGSGISSSSSGNVIGIPTYIIGAGSYTQAVSFPSTPNVYSYNKASVFLVSSTGLAAGGSITSSSSQFGSDLAGYSKYMAAVAADQPGTLYIEFSSNNGSPPWVPAAIVNVNAGEYQSAEVRLTQGYFRARYVNGATAQSNVGATNPSFNFTAGSISLV